VRVVEYRTLNCKIENLGSFHVTKKKKKNKEL